MKRDHESVLAEARSRRRLGHLAESRRLLEVLHCDRPPTAASAFELGLTLAAGGHDEAAADAFHAAVAQRPDWPDAWISLADVLRRAGRLDEADRAALAGVHASIHDPTLATAALALAEDRLADAEPILRARLRLRPTDVAAIRMLAELALRLGRIDDALRLLGRALDVCPSFDAARELLARTLSRINRFEEALPHAEALLRRDPDHGGHLLLKASLLVHTGAQKAARRIYDALLARDPDRVETWMSLGHVLKTLGRQADAVAAYRRAIALRPALGEAWWSLANLKTWRFPPEDVAAMARHIGQSQDEGDRLHLQFALGKALEDGARYAESFDHYRSGNAIRASQLDYDAGKTHDLAVRTVGVVQSGWFREAAGGSPAADPIFIVGMPRSGSTLVEQILASHSRVEGTMELPNLPAIAARLRQRGDGQYPEMLATLSADELRAFGEDYVAGTRIHRRSGRPHFIDKLPNNWQHVGLIRMILPNARIIDTRRHSIGCCFSAWKQHFARGQAFSYDLRDVGLYYRDYVETLDAFDRALPGRLHRVVYERMVADTEGEIRRLLAFLDLPFEDACLDFWKTRRAVRTASSEQVRQPIYRDGVDQWRHFSAWLDPLREALGPALADEAEAVGLGTVSRAPGGGPEQPTAAAPQFRAGPPSG